MAFCSAFLIVKVKINEERWLQFAHFLFFVAILHLLVGLAHPTKLTPPASSVRFMTTTPRLTTNSSDTPSSFVSQKWLHRLEITAKTLPQNKNAG